MALLLSVLSDFLDGKIARALNMVSELAKAMDPVADKVTQLVVLLCMMRKYTYRKLLFFLQIIKEICVGLTSLLII